VSRLGRRVLGEVANVARPDTILAWYRKLVARKFDGSNARRTPGRPRINPEVEQLMPPVQGPSSAARGLPLPSQCSRTTSWSVLLQYGRDFSCPYIIGYGSSPSRCGPSLSLDTDGQSRDIPASDAILLRVMWP
jgi:hypothetical protein